MWEMDEKHDHSKNNESIGWHWVYLTRLADVYYFKSMNTSILIMAKCMYTQQYNID